MTSSTALVPVQYSEKQRAMAHYFLGKGSKILFHYAKRITCALRSTIAPKIRILMQKYPSSVRILHHGNHYSTWHDISLRWTPSGMPPYQPQPKTNLSVLVLSRLFKSTQFDLKKSNEIYKAKQSE